jgi:hypothetical protein
VVGAAVGDAVRAHPQLKVGWFVGCWIMRMNSDVEDGNAYDKTKM